MRLDTANHELARLRRLGLFTWNDTQKIWGLVPEHVQGVRDVVAGRAFQLPAAKTRPAGG